MTAKHNREMRKGIPKAGLPAMLPALMAEDYLETLRKSHFDILDPKLLVVGQFSYQWRLWLHALKGTY